MNDEGVCVYTCLCVQGTHEMKNVKYNDVESFPSPFSCPTGYWKDNNFSTLDIFYIIDRTSCILSFHYFQTPKKTRTFSLFPFLCVSVRTPTSPGIVGGFFLWTRDSFRGSWRQTIVLNVKPVLCTHLEIIRDAWLLSKKGTSVPEISKYRNIDSKINQVHSGFYTLDCTHPS